jgi:hypothetical protein
MTLIGRAIVDLVIDVLNAGPKNIRWLTPRLAPAVDLSADGEFNGGITAGGASALTGRSSARRRPPPYGAPPHAASNDGLRDYGAVEPSR